MPIASLSCSIKRPQTVLSLPSSLRFYITNVGAGQGLLDVGSSLVLFINKFSRNTELYKLMTTKFR